MSIAQTITDGGRVKCPDCKGTTLRREGPRVNGCRRVHAECAYCSWQIHIEVAKTGRVAKVSGSANRGSSGDLKRCAVASCVRLHKCNTLCAMHNTRWVRCGMPDLDAWLAADGPAPPDCDLTPEVPPARQCLVDGCCANRHGKGLCRNHHRQWLREGRPSIGMWIPDGSKETTEPTQQCSTEAA